MRNFIIIIGLSFALLLQVKAAPYTPYNLLVDINSYRIEHGLPQLTMNNVLSKEAEIHSREMAQQTVPFSHGGFDKRTHHIFKEFKNVKGIAENVAYTDLGTHSVVKLWLNSPGHRKNIEGNYNLTGIGIATDKNGRVYATQIFLLRN